MRWFFRKQVRKSTASILIAGVISTQCLLGLGYAQTPYESASSVGTTLAEAPAFTINNPSMDTSSGTKATVTVTPTAVSHPGEETVLFELLDGTTPLVITAVTKDITAAEKVTAHFNRSGSQLSVKVFVVDSYSGSLSNVGHSLSDAVTILPSMTSALKVRILETTDLHTNLMDYDYYKDAPVLTVGLVKTATLIKQARAEAANTLLFDNGDLLQGTPLGTYVAKIDQLKEASAVHPMYTAMNLLHYDAATFGNHEFNYGLDFLNRATKDAQFPYVNANIYKYDGDQNDSNDVNAYTPYVILNKTFKDDAGNEQTVKVGVLGLVTPQITTWDKGNLEGKVITKDIVATAKKFVPEMKAKGADVIVALTHSGFDATAVENTDAENAIAPLSKVPGIDAITFSHSHKIFPAVDDASLDASFKVAGVDNKKGTINGVAAVQSGYGGANLGVIDLTLKKESGKWKVADSQSSNKYIYDKATKKSLADADQEIVQAVKPYHDATKQYANQAIGTTTAPIYSYFALVQDDPSVQIVTNAQKWYVQNYLNDHNSPDKNLPILSVGAPFKAGRNGPSEYTDISAGPLAIKSASDLYLYDNTLKAIKIKGSVVKEWLEMSAGMFNQIDPAKTEQQALLNSKFAVYNFDVIDGVTYQVDVTKPAKYNADGTVNNANSSRILNLQYNSKPIDPNQDFIVVTNNYRAGGGGNFPGLKTAQMVIDAQDENRQVLMNYITEQKTINPSADNNWSIAPINGSVNVTFTSSPDAKKYLTAASNITSLNQTDSNGFGLYSIGLGATGTAPVTVQLLGINDFHGQLDTISTVSNKSVGEATYLAAYLKAKKAEVPNTLLIHAGDSVGATAPVSALERDLPTLEWMNMMKFDVGTLGNHEFDKGLGTLRAQLNGGQDPDSSVVFPGVNFDYVNANAVDSTTHQPLFKPYTIKEIGGIKIGFIGVVTMATVSKVSPDALKGVELVPQAPVVNAAVAELKAKGIKTIVVLAHDPASVDSKGVASGEAVDLANAIDDEVDVIFAGDNHAKVNTVVDGKLIVQAYSYGTAFDDVILKIDPVTGDVVSKSADIVTTFQDGVTPDADSAVLVNKYLDKHPELKVPVGTAAAPITRTDAYNSESALGNLIADAMRDNMNADFAFMNPGGIRNDLPAGPIIYSDLAKVQPFGNQLVKLSLTGAQIKTLLQQQYGVKGDGSDIKTLQISGLKYSADYSKSVTDRVYNLTKSDGTPIDDAATYTAVVNNFMAAGGDNYSVLKDGQTVAIGGTDLEAFYNYIVKTFHGGTITAVIEGRITIVNRP